MLIDTSNSPYAKVKSIPVQDITLTDGLWKTTAEIAAAVTVPYVLALFEDDTKFHAVENFRIAAGLSEGDYVGPPFDDGDFYKTLEGVMYSLMDRPDAQLEAKLDAYIALIGSAQQPDGYLSTKQIIGERQNNGIHRLGDINDFEAYNFGHLMTAACTHKRLTGKDKFMAIAIRAAGYLDGMLQNALQNDDMKTAVCPSHYMGLVELYRQTGDRRHLETAKLALELRDRVKNGIDDNQDRFPLREHDKILGHGVRSTYLYAGVADVLLETGDASYKAMLERVWANMTDSKLYINGGCGALYSGMSPFGMFTQFQPVHQAFGYEYQLPNVTAYNETCATLGSIFWAHRMFAGDPQAKYFDRIERSILNLALASVSLDGGKFFYQNALRRAKKLDYELIWPLERVDYITCFCCPTNMSRFLLQIREYAYMTSRDAVWVGVYGASETKFRLENGAAFTLVQETDYPWDGAVTFRFKDVTGQSVDEPAPSVSPTSSAGSVSSAHCMTLKLRLPGWLESGMVRVVKAGQTLQEVELSEYDADTFLDLPVTDPAHTEIRVRFDMPARLIVSHPLVEENTNQVAVERGPLVYCMESPDAAVESLDGLFLYSDADFKTVPMELSGRPVVALETMAARLVEADGCGVRQEDALAAGTDVEKKDNPLYRRLRVKGIESIPVRMIPYFAWDNRGYGEMKIWMPVMYRTGCAASEAL